MLRVWSCFKVLLWNRKHDATETSHLFSHFGFNLAHKSFHYINIYGTRDTDANWSATQKSISPIYLRTRSITNRPQKESKNTTLPVLLSFWLSTTQSIGTKVLLDNVFLKTPPKMFSGLHDEEKLLDSLLVHFSKSKRRRMFT